MSAKVVGNRTIKNRLANIIDNITVGGTLTDLFKNMGIFPVMVIRMVRVGEESGKMNDMMGKITEYYEDELDSAVSKLIAIIEPLMIMVVAVVVGFIVLSMILPIFDMYENFAQ